MGVVYHAHYLVYFELGRTEFMRARGVAYSGIEERGLRLAVIEAQVRYRRPALYDRELAVAAWVSSISGASVVFEYELRDDVDATLATGRTRLGCLGSDGRPTRLPADIIEALATSPGRTSGSQPSEDSP